MENKEDIIGKKFNKITILDIVGKNKSYNIIVKCLCDCGNTFETLYTRVKHGRTKSCGCLVVEAFKQGRYLKTKHGMYKTRIYRIWCNMKDRCSNINNVRYSSYGGRGIKVCKRWKDSFENFKEDMYESYVKHVEDFGEKDTTIERKNVNGNYELTNCTWATLREQTNNQRTHGPQKQFLAFYNSKTYKSNNQMQFAKEHSLIASQISACLSGRRKTHKGWRFEYV